MFWTSIRRGLIAILSLFVLFSNNLALGQAGTTSIRGTVTDRSGGAIVGAHVTLTSTEQGSVRNASTNGTGAYEFLGIPPGSYNVTVEAPGFRKFEHTRLDLLVNAPATENITMQVGATSETIEVSAQAATLNTTDASMGVAFGENQIKELPLEGRNVPDLLTLQAGVVYIGKRSGERGAKRSKQRFGGWGFG
jgi:Carboxypeptidase regulatory-like domain